MAAELWITLGAGRRSSRGQRVRVSPSTIAETLAQHGPGRHEAWWSVHIWEGDHRGRERWQGAAGICLDIDHIQDGQHCAPPPDVRAMMDDAVQALPGSLFHHTPRGARVIFLFEAPCQDQQLYLRACEGAVHLVSQAIAHIPGYQIDQKASRDLARLMWAPRTTVDGQARDAELIRLRRDTYTPEELAEYAAPACEAYEPPQHSPGVCSPIQQAIQRWLDDHPADWGSHQPCPACDGRDSFSQLPGSHRWVCHHVSHRAPGRPSEDGTCYTGDALDLEAWRRGCSIMEVLRQDGYLPMAPVAAPPPEAEVIELPREPKEIRKTFASLCAILRHDKRIVPEELAWNELIQAPTIGGEPVTDVMALEIRERIELTIQDSSGRGLCFSKEEIDRAIDLVASERRYNPVVEYLESLRWDGQERLDHVADDYLNASDRPIYRVLFRKWAISAVARALAPGCQVDTVLVLQGAQGAGKSSFFAELVGSEWYASAKLDVEKSDRDAALLLSRVWVLEWGELESLQRAKHQEAIKEFITRRVDVIRLPYDRRIVRIPRHSVIVGTTNDDDFLADPTGARRYWVIPVGSEIYLEPIRHVRDQLWAEAVARYRAGEIWHLTREEEAELAEVHALFTRRDPWEEPVLDWLERQTGPRSTAEIMEGALDKPRSQWTTADARRLAGILKKAGYEQVKVHPGKRVWLKAASCSGGWMADA